MSCTSVDVAKQFTNNIKPCCPRGVKVAKMTNLLFCWELLRWRPLPHFNTVKEICSCPPIVSVQDDVGPWRSTEHQATHKQRCSLTILKHSAVNKHATNNKCGGTKHSTNRRSERLTSVKTTHRLTHHLTQEGAARKSYGSSPILDVACRADYPVKSSSVGQRDRNQNMQTNELCAYSSWHVLPCPGSPSQALPKVQASSP